MKNHTTIYLFSFHHVTLVVNLVGLLVGEIVIVVSVFVGVRTLVGGAVGVIVIVDGTVDVLVAVELHIAGYPVGGKDVGSTHWSLAVAVTMHDAYEGHSGG